VQFAANKKWAMSPLLSPPAGVHTDKTLSDKFVCTARIPRIAGKFNGRRDFGRWLISGWQSPDLDAFSIRRGLSLACQPFTPPSAVSPPASNPVAGIVGLGFQNRQINRATILRLGKCEAEESPRKLARSNEQSLLGRPPITLVCAKQVTAARLFAAKVVSDSLELLCAASRQARQ
jgi:hypothetical protein